MRTTPSQDGEKKLTHVLDRGRARQQGWIKNRTEKNYMLQMRFSPLAYPFFYRIGDVAFCRSAESAVLLAAPMIVA